MGALGQAFTNGFVDPGMGMAQDESAVTHHEVHDLVTVHIPLSGALRVFDVDRMRA